MSAKWLNVKWSAWEWSMQSRLSRGPAVRIVSGYHCVHFSSRREPSTAFLAVPGDAGRVSSTQTLFSGPKRSPCVGTHRQHSSVFLCKPPGRSTFTPLMQAGTLDPCVVPGQVPLAESSLYSSASQYGSRHPVECQARGMEASPRGMESFWPGTGGSVCDLSDIAQSPLVLSDSSSSTGTGCYGTDVAEASSVRLSPDRSREF